MINKNRGIQNSDIKKYVWSCSEDRIFKEIRKQINNNKCCVYGGQQHRITIRNKDNWVINRYVRTYEMKITEDLYGILEDY